MFFAKIPRHASQNAITEGDFKCILARHCESTEQLHCFSSLPDQYLPVSPVLCLFFLILRILNSAQQKKNQREPATFPSAMLRITRPIPLTRPIRRTRIA